MEQRLGRGAFLLGWFVLFVGQIAALSNMANTAVPEAGGLDPKWVIAILAVLQLLKIPLTVGRLNDIGRPASDAIFFCILPVVNIMGLLRYMGEATPTESQREARRRGWTDQIGPIAVLGQALPLVAKTAAVGLPLSVLYGVVMAIGARQALGLLDVAQAMDPGSREGLADGLLALAVGLAIYTAIQSSKRATASRLSWLPSLLLLPVGFVALGFRFYESGTEGQLQMVLLLLFSMAWNALWMTFGGAALMVGVTTAAEQVRKGEPLDAGAAFAAVASRTLDVAAPHGTRVQAIMVGNQIVIPGIFYMLQLAFADTIAVLKPDAAALKQSGQLTWGMRGRLFKLFLVMMVLTVLGQLGLMIAIDGQGAALAYFFDPREVSLAGFAASEILWGISAWVLQVALLLIYHDRVAFLRKRSEDRKAAAALSQAAPA